jgi:hypothetical protein
LNPFAIRIEFNVKAGLAIKVLFSKSNGLFDEIILLIQAQSVFGIQCGVKKTLSHD